MPPGPPGHRIAIYDLDRTITRWPTWTPFLLHAAWSRAPWRLALLPAVGAAAALKAGGLIDRRSLKQVMHRLLIGRRSPDDLAAIGTSFARVFERHIAPGARRQIAVDRCAGYRIVVATAAYRFYAAAIVGALDVDDLIATEAVEASGRVLARIDGANCYGADKLAMIERWMAAQGIERDYAQVRFYSDHASDQPTFDWADEAFAVNPHARLRRLAASRGWPVLDWH